MVKTNTNYELRTNSIAISEEDFLRNIGVPDSDLAIIEHLKRKEKARRKWDG